MTETSAPDLADRFVDLVLADEELLRAEFDAIVAPLEAAAPGCPPTHEPVGYAADGPGEGDRTQPLGPTARLWVVLGRGGRRHPPGPRSPPPTG